MVVHGQPKWHSLHKIVSWGGCESWGITILGSVISSLFQRFPYCYTSTYLIVSVPYWTRVIRCIKIEKFLHHAPLLCNNFNTHFHSAGPPNVSFTKKPYRDLDLEVEEPAPTSSKKAAEKKKEKERRPVNNKQPPQPTLYPTLPSNADPQQPTPPPIGAHHNQQPGMVPPPQQAYGGYGAPTYPNQQVYQQQGVPYGGVSGQVTADERTRLIND